MTPRFFRLLAGCAIVALHLVPEVHADLAADKKLNDLKEEIRGVQSGTGSIAKLQEDVERFIREFPTHPETVKLKGLELQLLSMSEGPGNLEKLQKLAADSDPGVAGAAKEALAKQEKIAALKKAPIDLTFKAADGTDVDFRKLRGKVVLLDFWASWCGPCMHEMPNVVKTWTDLKPKGFEVVGVSLDEEKASMDAALEKVGATWPQYFDGQGWKSKIGTDFGVRSIPATYLFDKRGMLRQTGVRGEALRKAVEKLLAEP